MWLCLQAQEGNIYFTELAERVEYGNYVLSLWRVGQCKRKRGKEREICSERERERESDRHIILHPAGVIISGSAATK